MKKIIIAIVPLVFFMSCNNNGQNYDATGTFEAEETIVSAEANGIIRAFEVEEGQQLKAGQQIGYIDSTQLHLKKKQLEAQINAVLSRSPNVAAQLAALREQLTQAKREQQRVTNLLKDDAATQKQLDDANTQVAIIQKQIDARQSALGVTSSGLKAEIIPLEIQIAQVEDQLMKSKIINPVTGMILSKYSRVNEATSVGKPLYKIADLSTIILRAYITGDQFANIKLNQKVKVLVDESTDKYKEYEGVVEWINDKAEFTPKTIQTKDERANLVYAIKIRVKNDGFLKIGMYGEVKL
ncbi:MAG TPA: HlyD family efflux transporter periplasmic adaptor subunit [Cytophagales bacterium]|nr:HlyD family efflux transporter periplasmic adaptor subunit [Cytophagales bacterium]